MRAGLHRTHECSAFRLLCPKLNRLHAYQDLEEKVKQRTLALDRERSELRLANESLDRSLSELTAAQAQLIESAQTMAELSRRAGMADIATGVLHNVGNALNSLNVANQVASERLTQFRLAGLGKIVSLLESSGFAERKSLEPDRARHVIEYLREIRTQLEEDRDFVANEFAMATEHV